MLNEGIEMTDRGKLVCNECEELATWLDDPPARSATSCDYWCDQCCSSVIADKWLRYKIKQELITFPDGSQIWYPYFFVGGEWKGWPLIQPTEVYLWTQQTSWYSWPQKKTGDNDSKKSWWQFWK